MGETFVGRRAELELLADHAARAASGHATTILIEGPAGVGKTVLVAELVDRVLAQATPVFTVLWASGDEGEQGLAYGVVDQLGQAAAAVLGPQGGDGWCRQSGGEQLVVGAEVVRLFDAAQDHGPIAVVVDDAQWADEVSLQALVFSLRRLRFDRVLAVVVGRDDPGNRLEGIRRVASQQRGCQLPLGGLTAGNLVELAQRLGVAGITARAGEQLWRHTQGNPLYAIALLKEIPAAALTSGSVVPAPRSFRVLVVSKLAACAEDVRRLVIAAAVLGVRCTLAAAADVGEVVEPLNALEHAVRACLLEVSYLPGRVDICFPHPMLRAAVYNDLSIAERVRLHARAAASAVDEDDRLGHRVAAAVGPDGALADELAARAVDELRHGAPEAAAVRLRASGRLCLHASLGAERSLQAAEILAWAGDLDTAEEVVVAAGAARSEACSLWVSGLVEALRGRPAEARHLLERAWDSCDSDDSSLRARIAERLAEVACLMAEPDDALRWARLSRSTPGGDRAPMPSMLVSLLTATMSFAWRPEAAPAAAAPSPTAGWAKVARQEAQGAELRAAGRWDEASTVLARAYQAYRDLGALSAAIAPLVSLSLVEYQRGRWDDALGHAEVGLSLARDAELVVEQPALAACAALVWAGRGDWSEAEQSVAVAAQVAAEVDVPLLAAIAAVAEVHLSWARGEHERVLAGAAPLRRVGQVVDGNLLDWQAMVVDALVRADRLDEGEALLVGFEERASAAKRSSSLANAARARAGLEVARSRPEAAERAYIAGLDHARRGSGLFDLALLELGYGALLRRGGRRRQAADLLGASLGRFDTLGACPLAERAARELAASGLQPRRHHGPVPRLTPSEVSVARLAAAGMTNRQIAAELVVSKKTVEFHLAAVFRKLGVSSRHQLADLSPAATTGHPAPVSP
jgi:DNA-binding CsgD family transcriptional regulator/tetratricopeptide (TPR) repeat protein